MKLKEIYKIVEEAIKYEISNHGNIRNRLTGKKVKSFLTKDGYPRVRIRSNGKYYNRTIHRLVTDAFISKKQENLEINHKNGIKSNNVVWNLELVTHLENILHAYRNGLKFPSGGIECIPVKIVETGEIFESQKACARAINGRSTSIIDCLRGRQKTHRGYHFDLVKT